MKTVKITKEDYDLTISTDTKFATKRRVIRVEACDRSGWSAALITPKQARRAAKALTQAAQEIEKALDK